MVSRLTRNLQLLVLSVVALATACAISACDGQRAAFSAPGATSTNSNRSLQPDRRAPSESPPPASPYLSDTWSGIHAFQPFDNFANKNIITPDEAKRDGPLYVAVWGSNSGDMVRAWQTNNPTIATSYYLQIGVDALQDQFANLGHKLPWWKQNHPDWILYECDKTTVALVPGIPQIPLDISNPLVIQYLEGLVGPYAEQNGYAAIGADFAAVNNPTGGQKGGTHGCGVWTTDSHGQPLWVQKFSGASVDPLWASAALNWLSSFRQYTHGLARPLALWGNLDLGGHNVSEAQEKQLLGLLDLAVDETGYTRLGSYGSTRFFTNTSHWAKYLQSLGKGVLIAGLFKDNPITNADIDYAIASYLLVKEQAAALFAAPYGTYGLEHYYPSYAAAVGAPCAEMYGGPSYQHLGQQVYYRQYVGALALANASASTYAVTLPKPSYTDAVTGATITSPLTVGAHGGFVLLTSNGCGP